MTGTASSDEAQRHYLIGMRKTLGFTQTEMAHSLGMSLRSYSDIETGVSRCRTIHILAAERVTLLEAAKQEDPDLLAIPVRGDIKTVASSSLP